MKRNSRTRRPCLKWVCLRRLSSDLNWFLACNSFYCAPLIQHKISNLEATPRKSTFRLYQQVLQGGFTPTKCISFEYHLYQLDNSMIVLSNNKRHRNNLAWDILGTYLRGLGTYIYLKNDIYVTNRKLDCKKYVT